MVKEGSGPGTPPTPSSSNTPTATEDTSANVSVADQSVEQENVGQEQIIPPEILAQPIPPSIPSGSQNLNASGFNSVAEDVEECRRRLSQVRAEEPGPSTRSVQVPVQNPVAQPSSSVPDAQKAPPEILNEQPPPNQVIRPIQEPIPQPGPNQRIPIMPPRPPIPPVAGRSPQITAALQQIVDALQNPMTGAEQRHILNQLEANPELHFEFRRHRLQMEIRQNERDRLNPDPLDGGGPWVMEE